MNREEATSLLKEIAEKCNILADAIMLMPPNADDVLSHGYQLHIKSITRDQDADCMKPIVESHNLAMANEEKRDLLVIYRPMKVES